MYINHQTQPMLGYHKAEELFIEHTGLQFGRRLDVIERVLQ